MECDNLLNFNNFFANFEKAMIKALKKIKITPLKIGEL
jgi:hypothetical protein